MLNKFRMIRLQAKLLAYYSVHYSAVIHQWAPTRQQV